MGSGLPTDLSHRAVRVRPEPVVVVRPGSELRRLSIGTGETPFPATVSHASVALLSPGNGAGATAELLVAPSELNDSMAGCMVPSNTSSWNGDQPDATNGLIHRRAGGSTASTSAVLSNSWHGQTLSGMELNSSSPDIPGDDLSVSKETGDVKTPTTGSRATGSTARLQLAAADAEAASSGRSLRM